MSNITTIQDVDSEDDTGGGVTLIHHGHHNSDGLSQSEDSSLSEEGLLGHSSFAQNNNTNPSHLPDSIGQAVSFDEAGDLVIDVEIPGVNGQDHVQEEMVYYLQGQDHLEGETVFVFESHDQVSPIPAANTQDPFSHGSSPHTVPMSDGNTLTSTVQNDLQESQSDVSTNSDETGLFNQIMGGLAGFHDDTTTYTIEAQVDELMDLVDQDDSEENTGRNLGIYQFFRHWRIHYQMLNSSCPPINTLISHFLESQRPRRIDISELNEKHYDFQGIDWSRLGASREDARQLRRNTYKNHYNIKDFDPTQYARELVNSGNHFRFSQMKTTSKARLTHFQLRNLMSATSKNSVYYAANSKIFCVNPELDTERCVMDFSKSIPNANTSTRMKVTTMAAGNGVLLAGGFTGEYALKSLSAEYERKHSMGIITDSGGENIITNHVQTFLDRRSGLPRAVFSSNDNTMRILDCHTNRFVKTHHFPWPVNCSATSPDGRLRLITGDDCASWVIDAETGAKIIRLQGHRDYGFACDWSPDGFHVATGNQDRTVQIWDARKWKRPIHTIATEMAGVRSMHFSPVGGGKRVLLLAEPGDIVSVVDADTYSSQQRFDFFGEIGGISFTPDGSKFYVANTDVTVGGLMEFDRVGYCEKFGVLMTKLEGMTREDWRGSGGWNEWVAEAELDDDVRTCHSWAHRQRRGLGLGDLVF